MPALYEIAAEHRAAMHQMADMADLPEEVITDTLAGIDGEFDAKAISVAAVIQNLNAEALAMKEAEARMAARRRATENRAKHLKEYLLSNMIFMKHTRIKCPEFDINIKSNPPSVKVIDEQLIPDFFKTTKEVVSVDKTAIKRAAGCPGVEIVHNKSLSIK